MANTATTLQDPYKHPDHPPPNSINILTLNCWGLKYISTHRRARLHEIGHQISLLSPSPEIVALQECWTQEDYLTIRDLTKEILPYGKFFWSGIFGGGLVILSKWEMVESTMKRYDLNGRPSAFWRGDWFVGKGIASVRVRIPGNGEGLEVFCTHLHAPYEKEPNDSYLCHRTAQAWEIAKVMRYARERGSLVLGLGDFNMVPESLAYRIVESHGGGVRDVWRVLKPGRSWGSAESEVEQRRRGGRGEMPSVRECLDEDGATCDSKANTWRWTDEERKEMGRGREKVVNYEEEDLKAKRLDYIFFGAEEGQWEVKEARVGMRMRHPELRCSLSDHFSVEATVVRRQNSTLTTKKTASTTSTAVEYLPLETYELIQDMIASYDLRERRQRVWRISHFFASLGISIGCSIAVWWSPRNFVSFLLMLLSTLGLSTGVIDGLIGFLFVGSELRALREFKYEIDYAAEQARKLASEGGVDEGDKDGLLAREVASRDEIE